MALEDGSSQETLKGAGINGVEVIEKPARKAMRSRKDLQIFLTGGVRNYLLDANSSTVALECIDRALTLVEADRPRWFYVASSHVAPDLCSPHRRDLRSPPDSCKKILSSCRLNEIAKCT